MADSAGMGNDGQERPRRSKLQTRIYLGSALILLVGLGAAAVIYLAAGDTPEAAPEFDIEDSRRSLRDLEMYGGKANVLVAEFMVWFGGLWHGRSLAASVACITLLLSGGLFCVAHHGPADGRDEDTPGEADR